jgi:hypothetical protein
MEPQDTLESCQKGIDDGNFNGEKVEDFEYQGLTDEEHESSGYKKQMDELVHALENGGYSAVPKEIKQTQTLNVVKTNTVKMEYFKLPMQDLNIRFLYRFLEPMATVWTIGEMTLAQTMVSKGFEQFAIDTWNKQIEDSKNDDEYYKTHKELLDKFFEDIKATSAEIYECEIVRKTKEV